VGGGELRGPFDEVVGELAQCVVVGEEGVGVGVEREVLAPGQAQTLEVVQVVDEGVVGRRGVEEDEGEVHERVVVGFEVEGEFHV
jgi:hypothetical protein